MKNGMKQTDIGELPMDWNCNSIIELGGNLKDCVQTGPFGAQLHSSDYTEEGVPLLLIRNITNEGLNRKGLPRISVEDASRLIKYSLKENDLVFSRVGRVGSCFLVTKNEQGWIISGQLLRIRLKAVDIDYAYIYYALRSERVQSYITGASVGSTRESINTTILENLRLPLPPFPEQRKIAKILSTLDEKMAVIDEQLAQTQELKKGLMQQLLTKGVGHTQFKSSPLGEVPTSWKVASFRDYTKVNQGLQIAIADRHKEYSEGCLPYITIQYLNEKDKEGNIFFVKSPAKSVICYEDEILMTRTGNTGIVVTGVYGVFHNNFFKVGFNNTQFDRLFLFYFLNSSFIQALIRLYAGSTTIPDLNHGDFYRIPLLKPEIEDQRQIAEILTTVDDKIGVLQDKKTQYYTLKKGLMQQLLTGQRRVRVAEQIPALV